MIKEEKYMNYLRQVTFYEFMNLRKGDEVYLKIGPEFYKSIVVRECFYNADADDPDFEIETTNGFTDSISVYI